MRCPSCGHDNITGEDNCERCQAPLTQEDVPTPREPVTRSIMSDPIAALHPPPSECVPSGASVAEAVAQMKAANKGYVCVTAADGTLAGIFTEREVIDQVAGLIVDLSSVKVDALMTRKATALKADVCIAHGIHMMAIHGFRHVPLVDDAGRPNGILSSRMVLQFIEEMA